MADHQLPLLSKLFIEGNKLEGEKVLMAGQVEKTGELLFHYFFLPSTYVETKGVEREVSQRIERLPECQWLASFRSSRKSSIKLFEAAEAARRRGMCRDRCPTFR